MTQPLNDDWIPILYREFYDMPRSVIVADGSARYLLFNCDFNDVLDDYEPVYSVYELRAGDFEIAQRSDWNWLVSRARKIGTIDAKLMTFDSTRRAYLHRDSVLAIVSTAGEPGTELTGGAEPP